MGKAQNFLTASRNYHHSTDNRSVHVLVSDEKMLKYYNELTSGPPTNEAAMLLRRAHIEAVPTPTLRTSVGKSSLAKT